MRGDRNRERVDIIGIVVIGRRHPQGWLRARPAQHAKHLVADGRRGRSRILRIERHHQQTIATARRQRFDAGADRRIAVAHRPVHLDMVMIGDRTRELFRLRTGNGLQRRLVLLRVPDLPVIGRFSSRARAQDDAVENQLPEQPLLLDHPRIGEKFLQIDAHAPGVGAIGRAEIDQEHADPRLPRRGGGRQGFDCNRLRHGVRGFARATILVKLAVPSIR